MVELSILVTKQQNDWMESQIAKGHFSDESTLMRELICERQLLAEETPAKIEAVRSALIEGEKSGLAEPFDTDAFISGMREKHTKSD